MFLIDEIIGENADHYNYTWGFSLDKPTTIEIWSNRAGFKSVSDVVRDRSSNENIYNKCIDQLRKNKIH